MAINPSTEFPGRITAPDASYDYGSAKNETTSGAGDGTPMILARSNDIFGFQQSLLKLASIVPSGNAETQLASQYLQAIVELSSGRATQYDESGIVNAYVLDLQTNQQGPAGYFNHMKCTFDPGNTNTGSSTINIIGLGVKNIFFNGGALTGDEMVAGIPVTVEYDLANDRVNLEHAEAVGFTRSGKSYIRNNFILGDLFGIDLVIGSTFESVGPTSAGATNTWTAMDNIPKGATSIKLKFDSKLTGASAITYTLFLYARKTGESDIKSSATLVSIIEFQGTGSSVSKKQFSEMTVPLDVDNAFDLTLVLTGTAPSADVSMIIVGFDVA